jgi:hypothetical protein
LKVFSEAVVSAISQVGLQAGVSGLPTSLPVRKKPGPKPGSKRIPKPVVDGVEPPVRKKPGPKPKTKLEPEKKSPYSRQKSTPEEVTQLAELALGVLRKSSKNLSAEEIFRSLNLSPSQRGRFNYAFNQLKDAFVITQHGERRQARYGIAVGAPAATSDTSNK